MSNQVRIWSVCALGVALFSGASSGAEKVQFRGSTAVELPKPAKPFEGSSRFKFDNGGTMDDATSFLPPPTTGSSGALDRKLREIMDRKKNWIFENPYERKMDGRSTEILEREGDDNPLMEHHLLQEEDKSMLQQFLEEKNGNRAPNDPSKNSGSEGRLEQADNSVQVNGALPEQNEEERPVALLFGSENSFFKERESSFDAGAFDRKMARPSFEKELFKENRFSSVSGLDREALTRPESSAGAVDFGKAVLSPNTIGSAAPTAETRLEAAFNPSLGPGTRPAELGARRTESFNSPSKVDFSGSRPSSLPSTLPSSGAAIGGFDPGFSKGPTYLPERAPTALGGQGPVHNPQPFVFDLPRRKF